MKKNAKKMYEQRRKNRSLQVKELKELKEKAFQVEEELEKQKREIKREFNIRNLKIFMNTCNFLTPFVLTASLSVLGGKIFGLGLPVRTDKIVNYKVYSLEYQTDGYVSMNEEYKTNRWFDEELPANKLTIYTPWELEEDQYFRYKLDYTLGNLEDLSLFGALLEEDYFGVQANIGDKIKYDKQEKQVTENFQDIETSDYIFKASLCMLDKDDTLIYDETNNKNIIVSISELVLTFIGGILCARFRNFKYLDSLRTVNNDYMEKVNDI